MTKNNGNKPTPSIKRYDPYSLYNSVKETDLFFSSQKQINEEREYLYLYRTIKASIMIRYKKKLALAKFWKRDYGARQNETSEGKKKVFKMTEGPCDGCEKREKEERALTWDTVIQSLKLAWIENLIIWHTV